MTRQSSEMCPARDVRPSAGRGRWVRWAGVLTLGLALTLARPQRAQAADVTLSIAALKGAYDLYKKFKAFFFDPNVADLIQRAVNDLVTYMNTQRDLQWRSAALSAVTDLRALSSHQPNDPTNLDLFNNIWVNLSSNGIDSMYSVLISSNDPTSSYQTAPVLNQMAAAWIGLNIMKSQIWPAFPATWGDYHGRLQRTIDLDYYMIGAQLIMCYLGAGSNPGHGNYNDSALATNGMFGMRMVDKQLYKKLGLPKVLAGAPFRAVYRNDALYTPYCNVVTNTCTAYCTSGCAGRVPGSIPIGTKPYLTTARTNFESTTYSQDHVIQIVREGMRGIMSVGGGDDPWDNASTSLPAAGMFVDPWVHDSGPCAAAAGAAYPGTP